MFIDIQCFEPQIIVQVQYMYVPNTLIKHTYT